MKMKFRHPLSSLTALVLCLGMLAGNGALFASDDISDETPARIVEPDDQYAAVTERVSYASGIVVKTGVKTEKKHVYRVDLNIYVADDHQYLRIIPTTVSDDDITSEEGSDICGKRGFYLRQGWNTLSDLTFTASKAENLIFKIHGDSSGDCDFYIDNFYLRDVTANEDLLYLSFDNADDAEKISGISYDGASQRVTVKGFERPEWKPEDELQYEIRGIIINEDFDSLSSMNENTTVETIQNFVRSWEGSHVTDYMLNIFSQIAAYPSEVATDVVDKYYRTEEQGQEVNYKSNKDILMGKVMFETKGIDYIRVIMEELPKVGINPWLSFRMNDAHNVSTKETMYHFSDFFYENPQFRRVLHGSTTNTYYDGLLDYSYKEVREYMLAIINEALSFYDCYGVELDFQREIWLWHTGGEYVGLEILTDFMRELDKIVKTYEVKYGHDIKVGIRCASDIQTNYDFGLDIITWAAEGLVDLVNPTGRFTTTDFDVPVKSWVSIMHPFGVEVAPGLETLILDGGTDGTPKSDLLTAAAAAANWYHQGADKIYLYNHFLRCGSSGFSESDRRDLDPSETSFKTPKGKWNAMITLGSYEKVMASDRRMILTYNDTKQTWKSLNKQLSAKTESDAEPITIRIPVGIIPENATATLNITVDNPNVTTPPNIVINGEQAQCLGLYADKNEYFRNKLISYTVPTSAYDDTYIVAEITPSSDKSLLVLFAEVLIDVEQ